jgi:hypothetical protein
MAIPTGGISVLPEDKFTNDDPHDTQDDEEVRNPDGEDEDKDTDDSHVPEGEVNGGRDDILSKMTNDDQKEMLE